MVFYYIKTLVNYILPGPNIEPVVNLDSEEFVFENLEKTPYQNVGNDMSMFYDIKRLSSCITHWEKSNKKFYTISDDFDDNNFYALDKDVIVLETCLFSPPEEVKTEINNLNKTYNFITIKSSCNLFYFDEEKKQFIKYTKPIKLSV